MKHLVCLALLFQIIVTGSSVIEVENLTNTPVSPTLKGDSNDTSKLSISTASNSTTSAPAPITTASNSSGNVSLIPPDLNTSTKESVAVLFTNETDNPSLLPNNSTDETNNTSPENDSLKKIKGKNVTLSSAEGAEPIILIPQRQYSAQSVIIPTLRAYQKYFTPNNPTNIEKRNIDAFTDTATPCPICGRMICGSNGNLCPVCLHSGRSNLAEIEKSDLQSLSPDEDPLALNGMALRKRRKNAWRVATIIRPGSLAAQQNKMPNELREGRNLLSWFGMTSSQTPNIQHPGPGQTLDYRPSGNSPPAFELQPDEQIIQRPSSSESSLPTFFHEASNRPQFARCLYPEKPVLIAAQPQISSRVSSFQTMLSAFH